MVATPVAGLLHLHLHLHLQLHVHLHHSQMHLHDETRQSFRNEG
jgi:hypothetical protein